MYTHVRIHTYTHVHPCTLLYTPMYTYVHSHTPIVHVHASLYVHVDVHSQIDMCLCHTYWHCMYSYVYSWLPSYEMYTCTLVYSTMSLELWSYIMPHMIQMPPYCITTQYPTRKHYLSHFVTPVILTTAYQQSIFQESSRNGIASLLISLKLVL